MTDIAVRVENLSKLYRIGQFERYKTIRETLMNVASAPVRRLRAMSHQPSAISHEPSANTIWALKDVSFEVKRGEAVGIIGRNGSGKTTILKILSRITAPTEGSVEIHGRVGSLLEVGTGFHPELTGRENIYLNGAVIGMKKAEVERKFDEIVAFSEIEKFLDTPVKRYSSGMYVRLAFAVAAHLEPEILLVDEVLAVGDAAFQKKCLGKMSKVASEGRTVLFVSHNTNAIRTLCSKTLWLSYGELAAQGETQAIVSSYMHVDGAITEWVPYGAKSEVSSVYFNPSRFSLVDHNVNVISRTVGADENVGVLIEGNAEKVNDALTVGFAVYASSGELIFWTLHTDVEQNKWPAVKKGHNKLVAWLPKHFLNEGDYRIELILSIHCQEWISQPGVNAPSLQLSIRGGLSESPYWMMARPGLLGPILKFESLE